MFIVDVRRLTTRQFFVLFLLRFNVNNVRLMELTNTEGCFKSCYYISFSHLIYY